MTANDGASLQVRPPATENRHPWSLKYLTLACGALVIRVLSYIPQSLDTWRQSRRMPKNVRRRFAAIPSRQARRKIAVIIYEPADLVPEKRERLPVHINLHGSGFVVPSLGTDTDYCAHVCSRLRTVVIDADYRKAPFHPFPAALEDVQDVVRWVAAVSLGVGSYLTAPPAIRLGCDFDVTRLSVAGFSAGANLAMSIASSPWDSYLPLSSFPSQPFSAVVSIYGNPDITKPHIAPSTIYDGGVILSPRVRLFFYDALLVSGAPTPKNPQAVAYGRDPRLSPTFRETSAWPKHVYVACGDADTLHEPGRELVERLKRDGHADVRFDSFKRAAHGFDKGVRHAGMEEAKWRMYGAAVETIRRGNEEHSSH